MSTWITIYTPLLTVSRNELVCNFYLPSAVYTYQLGYLLWDPKGHLLQRLDVLKFLVALIPGEFREACSGVNFRLLQGQNLVAVFRLDSLGEVPGSVIIINPGASLDLRIDREAWYDSQATLVDLSGL